MPRTTIETISAGSSLKRLSKETDTNYMSRITHCHLANQHIQKLVYHVLKQENFENCSKLAVLYLYDNSLSNVFGLEICVSLTRLYLQNNQIKRLEGFNALTSLQFLNLRENLIQHVDGIGSLRYLETLHLDKQKLDGQPMVFDEECLEQLSDTLKQLTCTQNNISNLSPLKKLTGLEGLDVSDNLNTADNICDVICSMVDLKNIIVKSSNLKDRYLRQKLIRSCPSLECINGKVVSEVEKVFTQRLGKLRKVEKPKTVPIAIDEDAKPIPHLPPYATQYR